MRHTAAAAAVAATRALTQLHAGVYQVATITSGFCSQVSAPLRSAAAPRWLIECVVVWTLILLKCVCFALLFFVFVFGFGSRDNPPAL